MKKNELLSALEAVKPGIASKDVIESMTYFFFSGTHVISYNDTISIQYPLKTPFSLFVKANDLYNILKKSSMESFELVEEDEKVKMKSRTLIAELASITDKEVEDRIASVNKSLRRIKWSKLPSNFSESISLCSFAAAKPNSGNQTLSCVKISEADCLALDNQRIAHAVMSSPITAEMLLQASEIKNLTALNPTKYSITKSWVHFKNEKNCIFSIRKVTGEFPNCMEFFDFDGTKVDLPKTILEGIDLASIITDKDNPTVKISIKENACYTSVTSHSGTIKHKSKIKTSIKQPVEFLIIPEFLKEMMLYSTTVIISTDRIKLQNDNFSLVTALVSENT